VLLCLPGSADRTPDNSTCNADLVCLDVYKSEVVDLKIRNLTTKPLTIQLFFTSANLSHLKPSPVRLSRPGNRLYTSFNYPRAPWGFEYRVHWGHERFEHDNSNIYILPYAPGSAYTVSQAFDKLKTHRLGNEYALDWSMPRGTALFASRGGRVVSTFQCAIEGQTDKSLPSASANHIWIAHSDGTIGKYLHLSEVHVTEGQVINAGAIIGRSGNTGMSTGPHLHFAVSTLSKAANKAGTAHHDGEFLYETFKLVFATSDGPQVLKTGNAYRRPNQEPE